MIRLSCPNCRAVLGVPDDRVGKPVKCPRCGFKTIVAAQAVGEVAPATSAQPGSADSPPGISTAAPAEDPIAIKARIQRTRGMYNAARALSAGAAVLGVVFMLLSGASRAQHKSPGGTSRQTTTESAESSKAAWTAADTEQLVGSLCFLVAAAFGGWAMAMHGRLTKLRILLKLGLVARYSRKAIQSLILAGVSPFLPFVGFVTAIVAWTVSSRAKEEIRRNPALVGKNLVTAARVLCVLAMIAGVISCTALAAAFAGKR